MCRWCGDRKRSVVVGWRCNGRPDLKVSPRRQSSGRRDRVGRDIQLCAVICYLFNYIVYG